MTDAEIDLLELVVKGAPAREVEAARNVVLASRLSLDDRAQLEQALDKYYEAQAAIAAFNKRVTVAQPLYSALWDQAEARARAKYGDV